MCVCGWAEVTCGSLPYVLSISANLYLNKTKLNTWGYVELILDSLFNLICSCHHNCNVGDRINALICLCRYSLAQEHGDLINLHEWYHSFKAMISHPPPQPKKRLKSSPSPKKRKESNEHQNRSDASMQYPRNVIFVHINPLTWSCKCTSGFDLLNSMVYRAEFCRAVVELQITGLLRMPSKRRPDYVQRVAFGLWVSCSDSPRFLRNDLLVKWHVEVCYLSHLITFDWTSNVTYVRSSKCNLDGNVIEA